MNYIVDRKSNVFSCRCWEFIPSLESWHCPKHGDTQKVRIQAFGATVGVIRTDNQKEVFTADIDHPELVTYILEWCADNGYHATNIKDGRIQL